MLQKSGPNRILTAKDLSHRPLLGPFNPKWQKTNFNTYIKQSFTLLRGKNPGSKPQMWTCRCLKTTSFPVSSASLLAIVSTRFLPLKTKYSSKVKNNAGSRCSSPVTFPTYEQTPWEVSCFYWPVAWLPVSDPILCQWYDWVTNLLPKSHESCQNGRHFHFSEDHRGSFQISLHSISYTIKWSSEWERGESHLTTPHSTIVFDI